mmetsp:Transcript_24274/g.31605  ORF Transcript_24274/g.31605 Transcript_24274/m.31605 type:complete len:450 (+) Transcript_24274:60-1409(+)
MMKKATRPKASIRKTTEKSSEKIKKKEKKMSSKDDTKNDKKENIKDGKVLTFGKINIQNKKIPETNTPKEGATYDFIPLKNPKMCEDTNAERSNSFDGLEKITPSMRSQGTSLDCMSIDSGGANQEPLSLDSQVCFMYIKPHCHGLKGIEKVIIDLFKAFQITILEKGSITGKKIDANDIVDIHYAKLSARATVLDPKHCLLPAVGQAAFQMTFGISWASALEDGSIYSASDAAVFLGVDGVALASLWREIPSKEIVKLDQGFYCGKIMTGINTIYVINGFYLELRQTYVNVPKLTWFSLKLPDSMSWTKFIKQVVGSPDSSTSPEASIRKVLFDKFSNSSSSNQTFNEHLNFVHVSASPLEAVFERMNWMDQDDYSKDHFGSQLLETGVTSTTLQHWSSDPDVIFEGSHQSVFNLHEGLDSQPCLKKALAVSLSEQRAMALTKRRSEF